MPAPPRASNGSNQSSARGKLIGIIVVAFVLFQIISAIARTVGDNFSSDGPAVESETSDMPWATDLDEVDVDVTHHEVWTAQGVGYYLVEVAPTEPLDVPVGVSITVETPDGSGSDSTWVVLTGDEPVRVLGELGDADADADLAGVEVYTDAYAYDGPVRAIEVVDWELLETGSPPVVAVHVQDTGDDEGDYGFVVVVVRDDSGQVVSGATEWAWALEDGEGGVVDVTLWDLEELPEGATIEVTAANV
ncbi:MAG: hypothetical protein M3Y20_04715 [Actinomycetota bacterium]|nr:hypothetical protein [Actinomycetota bacterium]